MTAGWTWQDWAQLATGIGLILYGLYRLRHAEHHQRKTQQRQDARGGGVSRYRFAEMAPSQRGESWWLIFLGAFWTALALLPR